MAHAVSLTDGTTTISLSSSNCFLTHYLPEGPETTAAGEYKPVTEAVEFAISATTTALVQTKLHTIERLLMLANQRALTGTGRRVYLTFQAHGEAAAVRSEILSYRLTLDDDAAVSFLQLMLGIRLVITRQGFWEGARTAIPLTNGNGSNVTTGLAVRNHNDAGAGDDNWATIAAADIVGSLPAPLELRLANASGAGRYYTNWFFANNIYGTALDHIIEGETIIGGYGTVATDVACSNGEYVGRTGAGWLAFRWYIPTATLNLLAGRYVRVLARFRTLATARREVKLSLCDFAGLQTLATMQTVVSGGSVLLQDCGALPLPATAYGSGWAQHVLEIKVNAPASETVDVDFVQLTPTEPLLYRHLIQRGYQLAVGDALVDDGIEGLIYWEDGATFVRYPIYVARNEPVHVWPGVEQRLLLLHDGTGQAISWELSAKAWYRPRRTLL